MRYLTDGVRLYEIVAQRTVQNAGLTRGTIKYTIIRDCVTLEEANVDDLTLGCWTEIGELEQAA